MMREYALMLWEMCLPVCVWVHLYDRSGGDGRAFEAFFFPYKKCQFALEHN